MKLEKRSMKEKSINKQEKNTICERHKQNSDVLAFLITSTKTSKVRKYAQKFVIPKNGCRN